MAVSCPQCGAAVAPGMRACQFCGARVESTEQTAEANAPASAPAESSTGYFAPPLPVADARLEEPAPPPNSQLPRAQENVLAEPKPEPRKTDPGKPELGKSAPKRRLMSFAVQAAAGLLAFWLVLFFAYRLLSGFTGASPFSTGNSARPSRAATSSGAAAAADLGVDVYPGARALSDPDRSDSTDRTVFIQSFVSSDKMDLVIDFYKARMVGQTSIYASGNGVVVSISPNVQETIQIAIAPAAGGAGTRITITHTTLRN